MKVGKILSVSGILFASFLMFLPVTVMGEKIIFNLGYHTSDYHYFLLDNIYNPIGIESNNFLYLLGIALLILILAIIFERKDRKKLENKINE